MTIAMTMEAHDALMVRGFEEKVERQ